MTVAKDSDTSSDEVHDDAFHPLEIAVGLAGLFELQHRRVKTHCVCGKTECFGKCTPVMVTNIHLDHSEDHIIALGDKYHGDKAFAWKAPIADFLPVPTDYGWLLSAPGQPLLAIEVQ